MSSQKRNSSTGNLRQIALKVSVFIIGGLVTVALARSLKAGCDGINERSNPGEGQSLPTVAKVLDSTFKRLSFLIGGLAGFTLIVWHILRLIESSSPFVGGSSLAVAPVVAIFGAFAWIGGLSLKGDQDLALHLRKTGIIFTISSFSLCMSGFLFPLAGVIDQAVTSTSGAGVMDKAVTSTSGMEKYVFILYIYVAMLYSSAIFFGVGTGMLVYKAVPLWRYRDRGSNDSMTRRS